MFTLEGVIVCHNYSDFLDHTLPENMMAFDRLVVVTHPEDKKTIAVCNKWSVPVVATESMHEGGDAFNKGRCINIGLGHLRGSGWILHLDADIILPHNFRSLLMKASLKPGFLYGADRVNVYGYSHWQKNKHKRVPHYSEGYFVEPPSCFPLGARIIHHEHGYCPIGYFQLWNASERKKYPIHQGNAEHTDVLFAAQWTREKRMLLPELFVYHLDSMNGPSPMGVNWRGRKSPIFGPCHEEPIFCPYKPVS